MVIKIVNDGIIYNNQFPTDDVFMSLIKVDKLYGYLQSISAWDFFDNGGFRYVLKEDYSPTKIAKKLGVTRATVYNQMNKLLNNNFVEDLEDRYVLKYDKTRYTTVSAEVLNFFSDITAKDEMLALYSYFRAMYNYHRHKGHEAFYFTRSHIIQGVWKKSNGSANYRKLDNILYTLNQLGLIEVKIKEESTKDYDVYYITNVADSITGGFEKVGDIPTATNIED